MKFYTAGGKVIKFRKNLPEGAHYYAIGGILTPVPTVSTSSKDVFNFVHACMDSNRPGITISDVEDIWDYYQEKKELLLSYLQAMEKFYISEGDRWRIRAYKKAYDAISLSKLPIASGAQAMLLTGVGKSIAAKIDEILETGKLEFVDADVQAALDRMNVIELFMEIWGVGPKKARKLYDKGYRTYDDIPEEELTDQERLGLKYLEDLKERIPRSEIEEFDSKLRSFFWVGTEYEIAGSYRRGLSSSGDIDVLVNSDTAESLSHLMSALGVYKPEKLAQGETKYMGIIHLGGKARRIDIRMVPSESWGAALLYFTGSAEFNVRMRAEALVQGMTLNEYRIARVDGGEIDEPSTTEEEIFELVGMKYVPPTER